MSSTNIYQEGLRLGPTRIVSRGKRIREWYDHLKLNTRLEGATIGDLGAQIAAIRTGERRLGQLLGKIGEFRRIISNEANIKALIRQDLLDLEAKHADDRRTEISGEAGDIRDMAELITEATMVVTIRALTSVGHRRLPRRRGSTTSHRPINPSPPSAIQDLHLLTKAFSQARNASETHQFNGLEPPHTVGQLPSRRCAGALACTTPVRPLGQAYRGRTVTITR